MPDKLPMRAAGSKLSELATTTDLSTLQTSTLHIPTPCHCYLTWRAGYGFTRRLRPKSFVIRWIPCGSECFMSDITTALNGNSDSSIRGFLALVTIVIRLRELSTSDTTTPESGCTCQNSEIFLNSDNSEWSISKCSKHGYTWTTGHPPLNG